MVVSTADDGREEERGSAFGGVRKGQAWEWCRVRHVAAPGGRFPGRGHAAGPGTPGPARTGEGNHAGGRHTAFAEHPAVFARWEEQRVQGAG